ncbi:DNA ligase [Elysia marginata]|uniref:DNA ligase n=1 Tax=Elysia marginata TaxID=1093978 RepID=A0AAV4GGA0_9GAST|nr:DNA ligase [Elysia marginata]
MAEHCQRSVHLFVNMVGHCQYLMYVDVNPTPAPSHYIGFDLRNLPVRVATLRKFSLDYTLLNIIGTGYRIYANTATDEQMMASNVDLKTSVASQVQFAELCGLMEKIEKTRGNDNKKRVLRGFVDKWREFHTKIHKDDTSETEDSFYPAMRLLLPALEKERIAYGIKEHTFAKLLIEVLCLGKDSPEANQLLHFKAPKNARNDVVDFASNAYYVLKPRCPDKGSLTIEEVNKDLDAIAANNVNKSGKDLVRKHLMRLVTSLSAVEQKWLIRMVMKELKMGLSQASVLSVYHPDAEELYNVNNNLEKVCRELRDPETRGHEIGVKVFSPFTPMLGERASPDKVEKLMDNKTYFIETKYDGERVLLHKKGGDYKYFSRSGNEYTQTFGESIFEGTLTPYIGNCFKPDVEQCILDGEMLGFHADTKTFGTKGEQFDIKSKDVLERTGYQPCIQVFDILLLNDRVLTNTALKDRLPLLEDVFTPIEGHIIRSVYKPATSNQECADALNEAIDNKEEGIMVKLADSVYKPNTRKGGWFKIKPEYIGGLMDELDVLIVGGYFGVGHRGGLMSHFLCAVAVSDDEVGDEEKKPTLFYSFCKVGSGYSKKQLKDFNLKLAEHWKIFDKKKPPPHLELASGFKEKPDAWLPPDKSFILQIKAAEIIESDRFKTGCTLRFPRVEMIREDKPWYQCMTTVELQDLREKSGGKLAGSRFELAEGEEPAKKKRRVAPRAARPTLMNQFQGADVSNITQVSQVLQGKEFCIVNGPSSCPKQELEKRVVELGGLIVQHPDTTTLCVIVEKTNVRVKNLITKNKYDVVRAEWLLRVLDAGSWIKWSPSDMIHITQATQKVLDKDFDEFGDSYTLSTSEDQLRTVFDAMSNIARVEAEEVAELEEEYFPDESPYGLFRTCRVYMDSNIVIGDPTTPIPNCPLDLLQQEIRFFGANLSPTLDETVSHVLVHTRDTSRVETMKELRRRRRRKFHIVTENWVRACMEEGCICSEKEHEF